MTVMNMLRPRALASAPPEIDDRPGTRGQHALLLAAAVVAIASTLLSILAGLDLADVIPNGMRVLVVVAAATLLPGAPIALLLRLNNASLLGAVTVSVSFATTLIVAQLEVITGNYSPVAVQLYLCALSAGLIVWASHRLPLPTPPAPVDSRARLQRRLSLGALVLSVAAFYAATRTLEPQAAGAVGIISHIGIAYVVALLLVAAVVAVGLASRTLDPWVLAGAGLALVLFTTMYVSLADGITSVPTAYTHRGLIDIIASLQGLPPPSDARFSWAGFFSAGAHMSGSGALDDLSPMLLWAPLFFGGITMLPLYSIGMSLTGRKRVAWLGVILYVGFNWYQQDYYAPQPTASMMYLTICAVLLWQLQSSPAPEVVGGASKLVRLRNRVLALPRRTLGRVPGFGARRTLAVEAILVLLTAAIVITHQLTPIVLIVAMFMFSLTGSTRYRLLWLVAAAIFVAWFSYGAVDYWKGHLAYVLGDVGQVSGAVQGGVSDRIGADPMYQRMQYLRLLASGALLMVGFVGWLTYRKRRTWLMGGMLSMVPFGLVIIQSYGGEVVIRCFLLASPFIAPYAAHAIYRACAIVRRRFEVTARPRHWTRILGLTAAVFLMALVLTATRGLNVSFEHTDADQISFGDELIRSVPSQDSILVIGTAPGLVSQRYFSDVRVGTIESYDCLDDLGSCIRASDPDFIFTTTQASAQLYLQLGYPESLISDQLGLLVDSGEYRVMIESDDLTVLQNSADEPVNVR